LSSIYLLLIVCAGPFGGYVEPEEVEELGAEWEEAEAPLSRRQRRRLAQQQQQQQTQVPVKSKDEQKESVPQSAEEPAEKAESPRAGLRRVPIDIIALHDKVRKRHTQTHSRACRCNWIQRQQRTDADGSIDIDIGALQLM